jgi:hypothetical protein
MAQQKSITFFFRKKREISEVDENDDNKEVNIFLSPEEIICSLRKFFLKINDPFIQIRDVRD